MLSSRFECKYLIHPQVVPFIRDFIEPYTRCDEYCIDRPGRRYPICSLYLDSADLSLYRQTTEGIKNRFKLRVRSYTTDPAAPVYFEIKRRVNTIILKTRARLDRGQAWDLLSGRTQRMHSLDPDEREAAEQFWTLALHAQAHPTAYIYYEREAYESAYDDPVRVTFDTELSYGLFEGELASFQPRLMQATRLDGVILEIKFTERFPRWVQDLVWRFNLWMEPVAKYVFSVEQALLQSELVPGMAGRLG